jgi:carbon-monoxide dehydrogenase medium subunit
VLERADGGRARGVRLAACGIADRPVRLSAAEEILEGSALGAGELDAAVLASVGAVTQADDMNTSVSYRRRVLGTLIRRLVKTAWERTADRGGK